MTAAATNQCIQFRRRRIADRRCAGIRCRHHEALPVEAAERHAYIAKLADRRGASDVKIWTAIACNQWMRYPSYQRPVLRRPKRNAPSSKDRPMSFPAQTSTVEAQPLIAVRDVRASSRWYAELLGADTLPDHPHRDVYDRIWRSGRLLLQLHAWDAEEHPNLVNADAAPPGHGVVLWFQARRFRLWLSSALTGWGRRSSRNRTSTLRPEHREIWLRDPDGYVVVVASPDGESG